MIEGDESQQNNHGKNSEKLTYKEMVMWNNDITIVEESKTEGDDEEVEMTVFEL